MSGKSKQILTALIPMIIIGIIMLVIPFLGKYLPGFPGEVFGKIGGILWSPFGLEGSLFFMGLISVFWINHVRRKAEGDEYVTMEIPDSDDSSAS